MNTLLPPPDVSRTLRRKWRAPEMLSSEFPHYEGLLVFTNGCFDILHAGHVRYLEEARSLGTALFVALNSDSSVRALKGEGRPINHQWDRAEVIASLEAVDFLTIFDSPRATQVLKQVAPKIYAKGGDYTVETMDSGERSALQACGAEIHFLSMVPGRSSSRIIQQLSSNHA